LCIDPPASFDAIQAANNHTELVVEVFVFVLDLAIMRRNAHSFHALRDESSRYLCFGLAYIAAAEQKLAIQV
jgi:hypothetical protein